MHPDINVYIVGIFVFKCIDSRKYTSWFQRKENTLLTRSTEQNFVHVPPIRTEHSKRCITYSSPTIWNSINFPGYFQISGQLQVLKVLQVH